MRIGITHQGGYTSDDYKDNFETYPPLAMVKREGATGKISFIMVDSIDNIRPIAMLARDGETDCADSIFELAIKNDIHHDSPCSKCPKFQVDKSSIGPHHLTMDTILKPFGEQEGKIKLSDIKIECEVPCESSFIESVARKALTINSSDPTVFNAILAKGGVESFKMYIRYILEVKKEETKEVPIWSSEEVSPSIELAYVRDFNPNKPLMTAYEKVIEILDSGRLVDSYVSSNHSSFKGASALSGTPVTSSTSVW